MFRIGYWTGRHWDCYHDRPDDLLDKSLGISYRGFFFGVTWTVQDVYDWNLIEAKVTFEVWHRWEPHFFFAPRPFKAPEWRAE